LQTPNAERAANGVPLFFESRPADERGLTGSTQGCFNQQDQNRHSGLPHYDTDGIMAEHVGLGVIGCGGFGLFALQHFLQIPGVRLIGVAGTHRAAALAAARRFGVPDLEEIDTLLARPELDVVYIATPPFLHHAQAMAALRAGKHVICEKPLAMTDGQADEMIAEAAGRRLVVANLMQRYNPLFDSMRRLIESKALGEPLHGYFENYAADEGLPPDHWFWDREKSGGIFIEHGVHFFDMLAGWLGQGRVVAAQRSIRPGTNIEEQVQCTVRYGDTVLFNFYHGFHQPGRLDRQELRIVFERGDVTLFDWVPTWGRIHAVADEASTRTLVDLFPGSRLDITTAYAPKDRPAMGRHKQLDVYQLLELTFGEGDQKMHRYGELLRAMFTDQLAWIRSPNHVRKITEQNGRDSLRLAIEATRLANA
jgi:predicted dehydrogenase